MKTSDAIRVVFGSVPKDSGTFTFYRNIRPALQSYGVDLRCVSVGREEARLREEVYADEGCHLLAPRSLNLKRQARCFVDWCVQEQVDIVMGINSAAILSALPHLPEEVRVMARCANALDHGYRITMCGRERLARVVALSPRLRDDLIADYGADPEKMLLIPNGHEPDRFDAAATRPRGQGARLELGFLGRLEHGQKGVLHLPGIVAALEARGIDFRLRIAGKGRHGDRLHAELAPYCASGRVEFLGVLSPQDIPDFLGSIDIFVFTSKFEGMPNALIEAMMAGAVPACFNIACITDFMIAQDETGFLCPQEDCEALAEGIAALNSDRARLQDMSRAAAQSARERFSAGQTAKSYAALFHELMQAPPPAWTPKPWQDFTPDPNFPQTWRRYVPKGLMERLKRWRS